MNVPPKILKDRAPGEIECLTGLLDAGDAAILATAVADQPDYFTTGDKLFFENPNIAQKDVLQISMPTLFKGFVDKELSHTDH